MKEVFAIAVHIITDSTCNLSREDQARLNVQVIPLTMQFKGASYLDGIDISNEQFFDKMDSCEELPTTSQIPPQTFLEAFRAHVDVGDEVVGIFITSSISGTCNSARIAKEMLGSEHVFVIDSLGTAMSLALLVTEAAKYRDAGFSAAQLAEHVTALTKKVRFFTVLNTLKYARKGGRVSASTAVIGEALGIKPIVSFIDGGVHLIGKARGMQAALKVVLQEVQKDLPDLRYSVAFAHACAEDLMDKAIAMFQEPLQLTNWLTCSIGSVIGTYAGRGAVGFAYIAE